MLANAIAVRFDESRVDKLFSELDTCHLPGAVVGIAIDGQPVYRKGFGLASMELPMVLSPSVRMRIGSTSKQFIAFAYMMLCEQGRARPEDTIATYLPTLNPVSHGVTMRQLMGNISGLRDATDIVIQSSGAEVSPVTASDLLNLYQDMDHVNSQPAVTYVYNNGGWVILGAVIERITGKSLEEALYDLVFEPIGMYDTMLRRWDHVYVPNSASCHTLTDEGAYVRTEYCGGIDYAGAGGIVSTVNDMLRWLAHMDAPVVGSRETWDAMRRPQVLANGTSTGYGCGLQTSYYRGIEVLHHAGGGFGSNAQMLKVPAAGLDVIVMLNRSATDKMATLLVDQILDACLPDLDPVEKLDCDQLASGVFRSPTSGRVIQLFGGEVCYHPAGGRLQVAAIDGHHLPFGAYSRNVLRPVGPAETLRLEITLVGDPAMPHALQYSEFGEADELFAVPQAKDNAVSAIVGRYKSHSDGSEMVIRQTTDGARMDATGRFGHTSHKLHCIGDGIWASDATARLTAPPWGVLAFSQDNQEFTFSTHLTRGWRFRRVR
jgi:CubicO group peptidase (beta-lactamase class C family)